GATYTWGVTNGTITAGTGTNSVTVQAGATGTMSLNVTVTTSAGCSDTKSANVNVTPSFAVTSVVANNGSTNGGNTVAINGVGFVTGATVTMGGTAATNVVFVNSGQLTAKAPAHGVGAVKVMVTNPSTAS